MLQISRIALLPILVVFVLVSGHQAARAQSGKDVLDRLQDRYRDVAALKAEFTQTVSSPFTTAGEQFSGTLVLSGDRYRVETGQQTIVTDGKTMWIYNADERQVLVNDFVKDETTFSLSDFLFHFEDVYEIVSVGRALSGGENHDVLRLRPKNPEAFFTEITVVMRERDDLVTRLEVVDINDSKMIFSLRKIEMNPDLAANTFVFNPPDGAEVVDLRE